MIYDPWEHADALGFKIIPRDPGEDILGIYVGRGAIVLHPDLPYPTARCVLAHEIVHAENGHESPLGSTIHYHPAFIEHLERKCDRIAAARLVNQQLLERETPNFGGDDAALADELFVTHNVLALWRRMRGLPTPPAGINLEPTQRLQRIA